MVWFVRSWSESTAGPNNQNRLLATSLNNSPPCFLFGASIINKSLNYMSKERSESLRNCFLLKPAGQLFTPMEKQDLVWITASARTVNQRKHLYSFILQTFLSSATEENHKQFMYYVHKQKQKLNEEIQRKRISFFF